MNPCAGSNPESHGKVGNISKHIHMGVEPKIIGGYLPRQIIHLFIGFVFHYFHHPFWGYVPVLLETSISKNMGLNHLSLKLIVLFLHISGLVEHHDMHVFFDKHRKVVPVLLL